MGLPLLGRPLGCAQAGGRGQKAPRQPCPSSRVSGLSLWGHLPCWLGLGAWCQVTTHWLCTPSETPFYASVSRASPVEPLFVENDSSSSGLEDATGN